ncbi:ribonuclease HII [Sphingomonas lacunae]|uniref:Ribonuclease HII n=1 Tax=Sphingomonas lacunae TaxID=2698828 RepID=A0A6M4B1P6_9SPHN|nr:ribonuclease HII [Sphingomonas lacunae]
MGLARSPPDRPGGQRNLPLSGRGISPVSSVAGVIIGVDEAGRGPLAGPVVAAAVLLCPDGITGLNDSKKLSEKRRIHLEAEIKAKCRWAIGIVDVAEIDRINIFQATMLAMTRAVAALGIEGDAEILIDGNMTPQGRVEAWRWPARAIVGGDALEPSISAASIIAKQARDAMMIEACATFPGYGFSRHKGYGTAEHMEALDRLGPCPLHRQSFAPVRAQLELGL